MILTKTETKIAGCFQLHPKRVVDERGVFVKTFHKYAFEEHGIVGDFQEDFYSVSKAGVLRGLHFQLPPFDHEKLVYCAEGNVIDVVLDLRIGSPSYGLFEMFSLCSDIANMIYMPSGVAHGFYTVSSQAIMMYKVSKVYSPQHDTGILWSSVGIPWPGLEPLVSSRDAAFPEFLDFRSPFRFERS